jgi:hypothetical protein
LRVCLWVRVRVGLEVDVRWGDFQDP